MQQTTGGQQNWKQTKVKAIAPLQNSTSAAGTNWACRSGQTSLVVLKEINFATEPEMMTAAVPIDLDGIKKMLANNNGLGVTIKLVD